MGTLVKWAGASVFFPTGQVLWNLFGDRTLVDETDDVHFARALGADKGIYFIDLHRARNILSLVTSKL